MALFCVWSIIFSFVDFNHFVRPDFAPSYDKWKNGTDMGIEYWRRVMFAMSGAASFTGAMSVVMTSKGRFAAYSFGYINIITYGLFALAYGYAGDAQMNLIFFFIMQVIGQYQWAAGMDADTQVRVRYMSWRGWLLSITLGVLIAIAFYYEIPVFARQLVGVYYFEGMDTPRTLDATTNACSFIAMALMMGRYVEQWLFWITVDCIQIAMFTGIAGVGVDINIVTMWTFFLANALWGSYTWITKLQAQLRTDDADGATATVDAKVLKQESATTAALADNSDVSDERSAAGSLDKAPAEALPAVAAQAGSVSIDVMDANAPDSQSEPPQRDADDLAAHSSA